MSKLVKAFGVIFVFVALTGAARVTLTINEDQTNQDVHIHHLQKESPEPAGWVGVASSEGGFSVSLPCQYNDYSAVPHDLSHGLLRKSALECLRPSDNFIFKAHRIEHTNTPEAGAVVEGQFNRLSQGFGPFTAMTRYKFMGFDSLNSNYSQGSNCAWMRSVRVGSSVIFMTVEPLPGAGVCKDFHVEDANKFFDSLKVTTK